MHTVNYHTVATYHQNPAVVKLLAREFIEGATYFSLGKWLEQLSSHDLDMLLGLCEDCQQTTEEDNEASLVLVLLSAVLTQGEGLELTEELAHTRLAALITFLMCESLYRKGQIEFDRSQASFGEEELKHNVIARAKDGKLKQNRPKPD